MDRRPVPGEFNPYFERYINLVPDGDLFHILINHQEETQAILSHITESESEHSYEEGKWTLKEVVGHMADTERIMSYRLLAVARGEKSALPSFEQDSYVAGGEFHRRPFQDLLEELRCVRQATILLLKGLSDRAFEEVGTVSNHPMSARALAYIIAGHELHHRGVIIEKYLQKNQ